MFEGGTKSDGAKSRYEHWAVCVGEDKIVHYQPPKGSNGLRAKLNSGVIQETLQGYMGRRGEGVTVRLGKLSSVDRKDFPALYPEVVVERARSKVGKKGYNLIWNNCEHFAKWCKYRKEMSDQIRDGAMIAGMLVGFLAGALAGILNGMAFAGLLGAVIGCCVCAVGGGGIGYVMTIVLSIVGRRDDLPGFGVLVLFSGDIGVMLNLYTSDMFACIWKGFLLSCIVLCVVYVYDRPRPWMKNTVHVALGVLQIGVFVAGYASTSAAGDFFLGVVGMIMGLMSGVAMVFLIRDKDLLLFIIIIVFLISCCTGAVMLTSQVAALGLCLGGCVGGIVCFYLRIL